jgi:hypothetical protein
MIKKRLGKKFPNHDPKKPPALCSKIGCDAPAVCALQIRVPALGYSLASHSPLGLLTNIKACDKCYAATDPQEMLNEDIRAIFLHICRTEGKVPPDFTRAYLEPMALDSEEYLDFIAKTEKYKPH